MRQIGLSKPTALLLSIIIYLGALNTAHAEYFWDRLDEVTPTTPVQPEAGSADEAAMGDEKDNGTDFRPDHHNTVWFINQKYVTYCVRVAPGFGVDADSVRATVDRTLRQWLHYVSNKEVNLHLSLKMDLLGLGISTNYSSTLNHNCDGPAKADLEFLFGEFPNDENVNHARTTIYHNPLAFAWRSDADPDAKGVRHLIWVAAQGTVDQEQNIPDWSLQHKGQYIRLHGELLHTIGHIFGNRHVPGTIMRDKMLDLLTGEVEDLDVLTRQLTRIDDRRYLFNPVSELESRVKGYMSVPKFVAPNLGGVQLWSQISHRSWSVPEADAPWPPGLAFTHLFKLLNPFENESGLEDPPNSERETFLISLDEDPDFVGGQQPEIEVFKIAYRFHGQEEINVAHLSSRASIKRGRIWFTYDDYTKPWEIFVMENALNKLSDRPISINILDDNREHHLLFESRRGPWD